MSGGRQYAWLTTANDENSAIQAAALGKSLDRVITTANTIVLVSDNLAKKFWNLLANYFDYVIRVDPKEKNCGENVTAMDAMKVFAFNMEMYTKIAALSPNNLVLQNCDELFWMEKDYYIPELTAEDVLNLPSIFILKPDSECYDQILHLRSSLKFCSCNIFSDSWCLFPEDSLGKLSGNLYNLNVSDFNNTPPGHLENVKIVSHDALSKVLIKTNAIQEIIDFWNICWTEIQNFLVEQPVARFLPTKKCRRNRKNYYKDSIAIVGYSCRFPEANNSDEFWDLLLSGGDGIKSTPLDRFELLQLQNEKLKKFNGGFLKCPIDEFDAKFFGISPREAELMDPQQRLLLEVAWEALENAAINPHSLKGGNTGVFTGVWKSEYEGLVKDNVPIKGFHNIVLGTSFSAISARISNVLGLNGPNITTESGCSSSMVALHLACQSLKLKETDLGLVMGANIIEIMEDGVQIFSKDGHCKTFDEKADGFGRAEGIAVIVLKRLSDAFANGDRVMGIIRGSAMSSEGTSSSFGTPSKLCQEIAIRDALKNSGVKPEDVDYIEAHGTGTPTGDPIEFAALSAGYSAKRDKPMIIGSVKTNIGHTESAAGLAGVLKVILSMKNEYIPRHKNFDTLNPNINLEDLPAIIPFEGQPWKRNAKRIRIAGISCFGLSGTNVHVLIQEGPVANTFHPIMINSLDADKTHHILNLSAKTENSLDDLADSYVRYLESNPEINIQDLTFTANHGRPNFNCRVSVVGKDISQLSAALNNRSNHRILTETPKIAFLFTGQGSQYSGMGNYLYQSNSVFRNAFDECSDIVEKQTGIILKDVLWSAKDFSDILLKDCVACQLSIFCVEYSLMTLLLALGVKPDLVLGHSIGEYVAAVASGIFGLENALKLLIKRSQLIAELPAGGMMAISCSKQTGENLISIFLDENPKEYLDISVVNSPGEIVVAGKKETLQKFHDFCRNNNIRCKNLSVSHAFHSRDIDVIIDSFSQTTTTLEYNNPIIQYVSGTTGSLLGMNEMQDGKYWLRHARETVNFQKGMETLKENNCSIFIEVGPRPILLALGMESVALIENTLWLPTLQQNKENWEVLLESLGKLYVNGIDISWSAIDSPGNKKKVELPTYPFQRQKYWINIPENNESKQIHPLLGKRVSFASVKEIVYSKYLHMKDFSYLMDHQVANLIIMPGAGFLEMILAAGKDLLQKNVLTVNSNSSLQVSEFFIESTLELEEGKLYEMQVVAVPKENSDSILAVSVYVFNILNGWIKHASAFVSLNKEANRNAETVCEEIKSIKYRCGEGKASDDFYKGMEKQGIQFVESFRCIDTVWSSSNESLVTISLGSLAENIEEYIFHPSILVAMLQAFAFAMEVKDSSLYLPIGVESCFCFGGKLSDILFAHVKLDVESNCRMVTLYNKGNDLLLVMLGVRFI